MSLTCVSSFFPVKNKHGNDYLKWFENTLAINCPYVFFTSADNVELIKCYRKDFPTFFVICNIEDFYTYKYRDRIATHSDHCPSVELMLIWLEKLFMIRRASELNPFNSEWFHWIDAGICTYRDTSPPAYPFPNNRGLLNLLPKDKLIYSSSCSYDSNYVTPTTYYHHIAATSYALHKNAITKFVEMFEDYLERCLNTNNIWTEQVIMTHMFKDHPELFFKIADGYGAVTTVLMA